MTITFKDLLSAYANGYFPMSQSRNDPEIGWFHPDMRGILPLNQFHIPKSLAKFIRRRPYEIRIDTAFDSVIRLCADMPNRDGTWINDSIIALYNELFLHGYAHSVECWQSEKLIGGLYGVSLGAVFFGESMFSLQPNASKVALVHLVERLRGAGYQLLDTQYVNDHLQQFGVVEMPRADYLVALEKALNASDNPSMRFCTASPIKF